MKKSEENRVKKKITDLLKEGTATGVFSGAAAAVSWGVGNQRRRVFGCSGIMDTGFPEEKVSKDTFFDLASLTKALATSLIIYSLINEKKLQLSDTLGLFFKDILPEDKQNISISLLLSHASGLVAYTSYFASCEPKQGSENKEKIVQLILREPLAHVSGATTLYSDLGFILLGRIIEKVTGESLEDNFTRYVTEPVGLSRDIFYLRAGKTQQDIKLFAATEDCSWRGRVMRAEVHDEHSWLMGGVSGHAGLFGRVEGVSLLCEHILDEWLQRGKQYAWSNMLQQGLQRQHTGQTWCLGFDTPSAGSSSAGKHISAQSVGHLGYAGTSFWIDPDRELVMVLLTNRVHPSRENTKIREFRPFFHDSIIEAVERK